MLDHERALHLQTVNTTGMYDCPALLCRLPKVGHGSFMVAFECHLKCSAGEIDFSIVCINVFMEKVHLTKIPVGSHLNIAPAEGEPAPTIGGWVSYGARDMVRYGI